MSSKRPTDRAVKSAIRTLISYIGDDPDRPGLLDTPTRVAKAWRSDWGIGYDPKDPANLAKLFEHEDDNGRRHPHEMVIERNITFSSHCEHHMAPFFGTAAVAYIPTDQGIVGISKLARIVDHYARRLQVQERLTTEIADFIREHISPDVAVLTRATHMCMVSRGIKQPIAETITSAMRGAFYTDAATRSEFLQLTQVR